MVLPIALGKTISDENFIADLSKMPHLLLAGSTGQGKSVCLNSILISLLYKKHPAELKVCHDWPQKGGAIALQCDRKTFLAKLPGNGEPIITDTQKVIHTLNALCIEMDERYNLLKRLMCETLPNTTASLKTTQTKPRKRTPVLTLYRVGDWRICGFDHDLPVKRSKCRWQG